MNNTEVTHDSGKNKGLTELKGEVMGTDACTACGTCVSLCPYIHAVEDRIVAVSDCRIASGSCYSWCPRTAPPDEIRESVYGDGGFEGSLGPFQHCSIARSQLSRQGLAVQYGGVATFLLHKAIAAGIIDHAVVTWAAADMLPQPAVAQNAAQISMGAGSKYALAPTNKEVNRFLREGKGRLGVVALPCQATGLRKRQLLPRDDEAGGVELIIGLFCTWALSQQGWRRLLERYVGDNVSIVRVDIPPPPASSLEIVTEKGSLFLPLAEVRKHIRPACQVCLDMTAENGDISLGMVEGLEGWNTVILRTGKGMDLWQLALDSGELEEGSLVPEQLEHLKSASLAKKIRSVGEAEQRREKLPYYERLLKLKERIGSGHE